MVRGFILGSLGRPLELVLASRGTTNMERFDQWFQTIIFVVDVCFLFCWGILDLGFDGYLVDVVGNLDHQAAVGLVFGKGLLRIFYWKQVGSFTV